MCVPKRAKEETSGGASMCVMQSGKVAAVYHQYSTYACMLDRSTVSVYPETLSGVLLHLHMLRCGLLVLGACSWRLHAGTKQKLARVTSATGADGRRPMPAAARLTPSRALVGVVGRHDRAAGRRRMPSGAAAHGKAMQCNDGAGRGHRGDATQLTLASRRLVTAPSDALDSGHFLFVCL